MNDMNITFSAFMRKKWSALSGLFLSFVVFAIWLNDSLYPGILSAFYFLHWRSISHYELIYGGIMSGIFFCFLCLLLPRYTGFMRILLAIQGNILELSLFCKINLLLIQLYQFGKSSEHVQFTLVTACIVAILFLIRYETQSSWKEICQGLVGNYIGSMLLAMIIFDNIMSYSGLD